MALVTGFICGWIGGTVGVLASAVLERIWRRPLLNEAEEVCLSGFAAGGFVGALVLAVYVTAW